MEVTSVLREGLQPFNPLDPPGYILIFVVVHARSEPNRIYKVT